MSTRDVFRSIYENNMWSAGSSLSGPGSEESQTRIIRTELGGILKRFEVTTLLDIPCGDLAWMKDVDLPGVSYLGADIVDALIVSHQKNHQRDGRDFQVLDLCVDPLPQVDLVFCRDCLVHLDNLSSWCALANIKASGSRYLMSTTFTDRAANHDIVTGDWRPLNLLLDPFELPPPILLLREGCTENGGIHADKHLALWEVDALPSFPR